MDYNSKWTGPDFEPTPMRERATAPQRKTAEAFDPAEFGRQIILEVSEDVLKPLAIRIDALENALGGRIAALENGHDHHQLIASLARGAAPVIDKRIDERVGELRSLVTKLEFEIERLREEARPGRDGLPGAPGRDGRDGLNLDDLMAIYDGERIGDLRSSVARLEFEIERLREEARPGRDGLPGIPGTSGRDGPPGADGLGFDDLNVTYDGERTLTLAFERGDRVRSFSVVLPLVLDRGYWSDRRKYVQGDAVTWAGAFWVAQRATNGKPDNKDSGWRLVVKAPRNGKSAYELACSNGYAGTEKQWLTSLKGERGPQGHPGRDGRW